MTARNRGRTEPARPSMSRRGLLALAPLAAGAALLFAITLGGATQDQAPSPQPEPAPPMAAETGPELTQLRFLAIADSGSGNANQRAVALRMNEVHGRSPVDLVVMGGDNIYPDGNIKRVGKTFLEPYRELLKAGVPFHAVLGNHDIRSGNGNPQVAFAPLGMKGRWYTLRRGPVEFFMLDTNVTTPWEQQLPWLRQALASSDAPWKVAVGHHPIYSSGHYGDDAAAIARLTPLFRRYGVQLYINGHEHNYERTQPIAGTTYLIVGGSGAYLRPVRPNARSARAVSTYSFAELSATEDTLSIQAWDSQGRRIDNATLRRSAP
jgi:3',5'-cyclic AMP phosphodiesterase CpdA